MDAVAPQSLDARGGLWFQDFGNHGLHAAEDSTTDCTEDTDGKEGKAGKYTHEMLCSMVLEG